MKMALLTNLTSTTCNCKWLPLEYKRQLESSKFLMASTIGRVVPSRWEGGNLNLKKNDTYKYNPQGKKINDQVTHSMPQEKLEIFKSLEPWANDNILVLLKPVEYCWQPQDLLPKPESTNFFDQIVDLKERSLEISDDQIVVLVGDMITKMAQPTYHTLLNTLDGVEDMSGVSLSPWAIWTRAWSAEENRHGDVLNKYLYLTGRLDMKSVEHTIQYLIGSGMDAQFENNPYLAYIYFSFQERASVISYGKNALLAQKHGDTQLSKICTNIVNDERRHESAYTKIVEKLFELDPDTTMIAFADMIKKRFKMPGHLMYDGKDKNIFENYSSVVNRLGIFSVEDYGDILEYFIGRWRVDKLTGLSTDGRKAQEFVCNLPMEFKRFEVIREERGLSTVPFSWIFGKHVKV